MTSVLYFAVTFAFLTWLVWTLALSEYLDIERERKAEKSVNIMLSGKDRRK